MNTINLLVDNIKCDGCVRSIKTELSKNEVIHSVDVNKEKGEVAILGENIDQETIYELLAKIGFPKRKRKSSFFKIFNK